ncbi:flavin-containing monooxygenase [Pseudidiomarina sp.]|uniref:flavin-containing monooxygenase n=1 Tax=Pseudidiomarina sp. TaxID=2081707 RepID=UPI00299E551A|nr:FAD-dependent oxidoreductase [Pseudidiomarina sp.]MDX1705948.1 FAD-dependent oxidoreductase [Pseudidiomarina sp.]
MAAAIHVAVIGAGPSGLAAAKNCIQQGLKVTLFEKNDQVGGNWVFNSKTGHSSVYNNTHIISSRYWSEYEDFPMPEDYPDYPNHRQLQAYFHRYAEHFSVLPVIQFNSDVLRATPGPDGHWKLTVKNEQGDEEQQVFTHLMVANGHHWNPKYPEYPGEFNGRIMHSHDFKGVDDSWRDKRVLVIGAGNSACDVAVESARVAGTVALSMRSPQWFLPKFMFGVPTDELGSRMPLWVPVWLRQRLLTWLVRLLQGDYKKRYNLPRPEKPLLSQHPTVNSDLLDYIRHGRITPRPAISRYHASGVEFVDGTKADFDIIVACTGFRISFPFFDADLIDFEQHQRTPLYLKMIPQKFDNLYFIGLFQPLGCIWPLADHQARLAVAEIQQQYRRPQDLAAAIKYEMEHPHLPFEAGGRHSTEVDYQCFRRDLATQLQSAGIDIGPPPKAFK